MGRAIVTGGSRGIGKAIADFLRRDYEVLTIGRGKDNDIRADLTFEYHNLITSPVDVLVNNAGFQHFEPAIDFDMFYWDKQMDMLRAYFDLSRQAYKQRVKRIINIASVAGIRGTRGCVGYSVAKSGVVHMTKCLSNEWAGKCTVNAIAPGFIETDLLTFNDEAHRQRIIDYIPAGRLGTPADVVPVIEFLLKADYVTGAVIPVDGGFLAR